MIQIRNTIRTFFLASLLIAGTAGAATKVADLQAISKESVAIAKRATPAVVSIQVKAAAQKNWQSPDQRQNQEEFYQFFERFFGNPMRERQQQEAPPAQGQASGFLVSHDGYIMTNNHVVEGSDEINVLMNNGKEFSATIVGQDNHTDIAVIKIEAEGLPFLELGDSDDISVAEWVMAIGNPLGLQASVTTGVVSAKGRDNLDLVTIEDFIQTDAAINRGNSGGPLLNLDGEVIGINTAIVTNMGTGGYMGIGFAVPSNIAKHAMDHIIESGSVTRGFLGVILQKIDNNLALSFGLDKVEGALVAEVQPGSPAEKSGLQQGDIVIEFEGKPVTGISSLRNAVSMKKPGAVVQVTLLRDNEKKALSIEIGNRPDQSLATANKFGIEVQDITPEIAKQLGYENDQGVIVSSVKQGSPASYVGLQKGALILEVNQTKVSSTEEFEKALSEASEEKPALFLVKQGAVTRYISLKIG